MASGDNFSDWTSVGTHPEGVSAHTVASRDAQADGVIVEFPTDGIQTAQDSSLAENMDADKITPSTGSSAAGSSFGRVPKSCPPAAIQADDASDPSWSLVSATQMSALSLGSELASSGDDNFDVVCLDSGVFAMGCKRCSFLGPLGVEICDCCDFGSSATALDEQIALALQFESGLAPSDDPPQQEETDGCLEWTTPGDPNGAFGRPSSASSRAVESRPVPASAPASFACHEDICRSSGLGDSTVGSFGLDDGARGYSSRGDGSGLGMHGFLASDPGSKFVRDLNSFLSGLPPVGLQKLADGDLLGLAASFAGAITSAGRSKISLAYTATPSDEGTWNRIRTGGFRLGKHPRFTNDVDAALSLLFRAPNARPLYPILEGREERWYSGKCCWIAATARFENAAENIVKAPRSGWATVWNLRRPELALPLVRFSPELRHTDVVRVLFNGLSKILRSHFGEGRGFRGNGATLAPNSSDGRHEESDEFKFTYKTAE